MAMGGREHERCVYCVLYHATILLPGSARVAVDTRPRHVGAKGAPLERPMRARRCRRAEVFLRQRPRVRMSAHIGAHMGAHGCATVKMPGRRGAGGWIAQGRAATASGGEEHASRGTGRAYP